jgi:hypothetical protein
MACEAICQYFSQTSILPHRMIKFKGIRRGAYEMSTGVLSTQGKIRNV